MEVRGRDSAGLHVFVWHDDLDVADPAIAATIALLIARPAVPSRIVRLVDGTGGVGKVLSFVYKAAAEIGGSATTPRRYVRSRR